MGKLEWDQGAPMITELKIPLLVGLSNPLVEHFVPSSLLRDHGIGVRATSSREGKVKVFAQRGKCLVDIIVVHQGVQADGRFQSPDSGFLTPNGRFDFSRLPGTATPVFAQPDAAPSGLKLGTEASIVMRQVGEQSSTFTLHVLTHQEYVSISIFYPPKVRREAGRTEAQDKELAERLARHILSRTAGQRMAAGGQQTVQGVTVNSVRCTRSNRRFVDLRSWCERSGWTVAESSMATVITLRKGAREATIPLGSREVRVNGSWRSGGDIPAIVEGRVYVPVSMIDALSLN